MYHSLVDEENVKDDNSGNDEGIPEETEQNLIVPSVNI